MPQEIDALTKSTESLKNEIQGLEAEKSNILGQLEATIVQRDEAQQSLDTINRQYEKSKREVDKAYRRIYMEGVSTAVFYKYLAVIYNSASGHETNVLTAYDAISSVIDGENIKTLYAIKIVPDRIVLEMNARIKKKLLENKHVLNIPLQNIELPSSDPGELTENNATRWSNLADIQQQESERAKTFLEQF